MGDHKKLRPKIIGWRWKHEGIIAINEILWGLITLHHKIISAPYYYIRDHLMIGNYLFKGRNYIYCCIFKYFDLKSLQELNWLIPVLLNEHIVRRIEGNSVKRWEIQREIQRENRSLLSCPLNSPLIRNLYRLGDKFIRTNGWKGEKLWYQASIGYQFVLLKLGSPFVVSLIIRAADLLPQENKRGWWIRNGNERGSVINGKYAGLSTSILFSAFLAPRPDHGPYFHGFVDAMNDL